MEPESMELEPEVNAVPVSVEPVSIGIQCDIVDLHSFKDQATQVSRDTKEIGKYLMWKPWEMNRYKYITFIKKKMCKNQFIKCISAYSEAYYYKDHE